MSALGPMNINEIGGGKVRRAFSSAAIAAMLDQKGERLVMGTMLTREHLQMIPTANRNALIENRFIDVWPMRQMPGGGTSTAPRAAAHAPGERHVVSKGFGKFDVIEGHKLNADPLSKAEAEALASAAPKAEPKPDKPKGRGGKGKAAKDN